MFDSSTVVTVPAGAALAAALEGFDVSTLDEDKALAYAAACRRQLAHYEARQHRAVAAFSAHRGRVSEPVVCGMEQLHTYGGEGTPPVGDFASGELAAEWGCAGQTASTRLGDSLDLVHRVPNTLAALESGGIDGFTAQTIARTTRNLDAAATTTVEAEVLPRAGTVTNAKLRALVEAAAIAADPDGSEERRTDERRRTCVDVGQSTHGVSEVYARVETPDALRLDARVDQVARWLQLAGDTGGIDRRRATAFGMLADPDRVRDLFHRVHGTIGDASTAPPHTVLYVHHQRGADGTSTWTLDGAGAISRAEAEELLARSHVTVKPVIDLADMAPSAGYEPSDALTEGVQLVNPTCRFPFCPRRAQSCDCDHTIGWPRGPTAADNLGPLCRHHHRIKTHGDWQLTQPFQGIFVWRSPTGRVYLVDHHGTHKSAA